MGLYCDDAQNETPYRFVDPSRIESDFAERKQKAFRREMNAAQRNTSDATLNNCVSSSQSFPYKDPTSPSINSVDLQTEFHTSSQSLAMVSLLFFIYLRSAANPGKENPITGNSKPLFQSTLKDDARDIQSQFYPYSIGEADYYSDYPDIRGDVCRGDDVPLAFIVFISEPVLQKQLEYLKDHSPYLKDIHRAFSEARVEGPMALPYALCLVKILRQRAWEQLSMKRLNDTIHFLSMRLRALLSTPLLYTSRGRISRVSLLFGRQVFRRGVVCGVAECWRPVTVSNFVLDDNLTVTLHFDGTNSYKVPNELWNGSDPLRFDVVDPASIFGVA
ncbi:hypothetical protein AJ78_08100 [Emergomyces pasteurianus Ep9510]|uniref:Uncharacterized protein n=1 Tax=Emergomyces pasteurianus Ep9510 TaxID=1447872 RepID=A0A1J9P5A2_9EURO|nr:hypothetical protein AJ78_08100 [Emergomyces pasteurianus Ep9510]